MSSDYVIGNRFVILTWSPSDIEQSACVINNVLSGLAEERATQPFCGQLLDWMHAHTTGCMSNTSPVVTSNNSSLAFNMKRSAEVFYDTATKKVCVNSSYGLSLEDLPPHYISLGGNKLANVTDFSGTVRVHIRSYFEKGEKLFPSKNGVTMSAKTFKEFMEKCFMYDGSNEVAVFNKELMMNCSPSPREVIYRFQQLHIQADGTFILTHSSVFLTWDQFNTLRDSCEKLWVSVQKLQFGPSFQDAFLQHQGTLTSYSWNIQKLEDLLAEVLRTAIKENIEKVFYCKECHLPAHLMPNNQLGHDCMNTTASDRWNRCFDKAFALIKPKVLGIAFASSCSVGKVPVPRSMLEQLDVCGVLKAVEDMVCDDEF